MKNSILATIFALAPIANADSPVCSASKQIYHDAACCPDAEPGTKSVCMSPYTQKTNGLSHLARAAFESFTDNEKQSVEALKGAKIRTKYEFFAADMMPGSIHPESTLNGWVIRAHALLCEISGCTVELERGWEGPGAGQWFMELGSNEGFSDYQWGWVEGKVRTDHVRSTRGSLALSYPQIAAIRPSDKDAMTTSLTAPSKERLKEIYDAGFRAVACWGWADDIKLSEQPGLVVSRVNCGDSKGTLQKIDMIMDSNNPLKLNLTAGEKPFTILGGFDPDAFATDRGAIFVRTNPVITTAQTVYVANNSPYKDALVTVSNAMIRVGLIDALIDGFTNWFSQVDNIETIVSANTAVYNVSHPSMLSKENVDMSSNYKLKASQSVKFYGIGQGTLVGI